MHTVARDEYEVAMFVDRVWVDSLFLPITNKNERRLGAWEAKLHNQDGSLIWVRRIHSKYVNIFATFPILYSGRLVIICREFSEAQLHICVLPFTTY